LLFVAVSIPCSAAFCRGEPERGMRGSFSSRPSLFSCARDLGWEYRLLSLRRFCRLLVWRTYLVEPCPDFFCYVMCLSYISFPPLPSSLVHDTFFRAAVILLLSVPGSIHRPFVPVHGSPIPVSPKDKITNLLPSIVSESGPTTMNLVPATNLHSSASSRLAAQTLSPDFPSLLFLYLSPPVELTETGLQNTTLPSAFQIPSPVAAFFYPQFPHHARY